MYTSVLMHVLIIICSHTIHTFIYAYVCLLINSYIYTLMFINTVTYKQRLRNKYNTLWLATLHGCLLRLTLSWVQERWNIIQAHCIIPLFHSGDWMWDCLVRTTKPDPERLNMNKSPDWVFLTSVFTAVWWSIWMSVMGQLHCGNSSAHWQRHWLFWHTYSPSPLHMM